MIGLSFLLVTILSWTVGATDQFEEGVIGWSKQYIQQKYGKEKVLKWVDLYGQHKTFEEVQKTVPITRVTIESEDPRYLEKTTQTHQEELLDNEWHHSSDKDEDEKKNKTTRKVHFKVEKNKQATYLISLENPPVKRLKKSFTIDINHPTLRASKSKGKKLHVQLSQEDGNNTKQFSQNMIFLEDFSLLLPANRSLNMTYTLTKVTESGKFTFKSFLEGDFLIFSRSQKRVRNFWDKTLDVVNITDVFKDKAYKGFTVEGSKVIFETTGKMISTYYNIKLATSMYNYVPELEKMSKEDRKKHETREDVSDFNKDSLLKVGEVEERENHEQSSPIYASAEEMYGFSHKSYDYEDDIDKDDNLIPEKPGAKRSFDVKMSKEKLSEIFDQNLEETLENEEKGIQEYEDVEIPQERYKDRKLVYVEKVGLYGWVLISELENHEQTSSTVDNSELYKKFKEFRICIPKEKLRLLPYSAILSMETKFNSSDGYFIGTSSIFLKLGFALTAAHNIVNFSNVEAVNITSFIMRNGNKSKGIHTALAYAFPVDFLENRDNFDYAVLYFKECNEIVKKTKWIEISKENKIKNAKISGYANKLYSDNDESAYGKLHYEHEGNCFYSETNNQLMEYNIQTGGGQSGSPVRFRNEGENEYRTAAIHIRGDRNWQEKGAVDMRNQGIRITKDIYDRIIQFARFLYVETPDLKKETFPLSKNIKNSSGKVIGKATFLKIN